MSGVFDITRDQIRLIATMFKIQYGDKTMFDVFGCGGARVKISEYVLFEHESVYNSPEINVFWLELRHNNIRHAWFKHTTVRGQVSLQHTNFKWNKNGQHNDKYQKSLLDFVKLLSFEDKI